MAQRTEVILIDDLDGGKGDETVRFGLDGTNYIIDLSKKNAKAIRDALNKYIDAARKEGRMPVSSHGRAGVRGRATGTARAGREQNQAIRDWLKGRGIEVSERGRIKQEYVDMYHAEAGR